MADRQVAFVSGRARRLFLRVRFHFWPQRRRYTCILFLSCERPRSRSRQNSRARQRTDPLRPVNLKLEVAWPWTWSACATDSCWWIYWWRALERLSSRGSGGRLVSITWWSASVVVRCGRRVRQTLFHTVGGTGTLRRDKERGVLGVGVLFRDHVPGSGAWRFFCGRPGVFCVLPSFGRATIVSPPRRVQSCFGRSSFQPSTRRRSRDALPAKRCTCRSGWSQRAFKHCLVTLYRDRGICSSKDACLVLLKRPPAPGMLESNVVCQLDPSVSETDEPDEYRFHYRILEADQNGNTPDMEEFNQRGKTALHRLIDNKNKVMIRWFRKRLRRPQILQFCTGPPTFKAHACPN